MRTRDVAAVVVTLALVCGSVRAAAADQTAVKVSPPKNVVVWGQPGGFAGWPANNGAWIWGNEILVGFTTGSFKDIPGNHAIDRSKPQATTLARSLDGGETWTLETLPPQPRGQADVNPGSIDFTNPNFAMRVSGNRYIISYDRGHTWTGPMSFPTFDLKGISGRTDYIVNGKDDCIAFLSANSKYGREGRPYCIRTIDGGKTWTFLSWIGPDYDGYAIMPSSVRLPNNRIISAVRTQDSKHAWMPVYFSDDDGKTWNLLSDATVIPGGSSNPPGMIRLADGRIVLAYGYRYSPYGIRARISKDEGKTWSSEIVLRKDGGCWDLGYNRTLLRPDGKIVTIYYFNYAEDKERSIEATIWDPNYLPPSLGHEMPKGRLAAGTTDAKLEVESDIDATCKFDTRPGIPFNAMQFAFDHTGGKKHDALVHGLQPGTAYTFYVKSKGTDGTTNFDDCVITFFVTDPAKLPYRTVLGINDAKLTPPMAIAEQAGALQGKALSSPKDNQGSAEFSFTIPHALLGGQAGDYVVWTHVLGPTYNNDSYFVTVDGASEDIFDVNSKLECGYWRWVKINGHGGRAELTLHPRIFKRTEGTHTIAFRAREGGAFIDKVVVTDDDYFMPEGE